MQPSCHYLYVKQSDLYPAGHFKSGLLLAALILMLVYFLPFNWQDPIWLLYIEVSAFFIGYIAAYNRKVKRFFTFKGEMREEVHQKALEAVKEYGLDQKGSYVFIFASQMERCLTCLFSSDIEKRLEEEGYLRTIQKLLKEQKQALKGGNIKETLEQTSERIAQLFISTSVDTTVDTSTDTSTAQVTSRDDNVGIKTLGQETAPEKPVHVEEKLPETKVDDKTDSQESNQTNAE